MTTIEEHRELRSTFAAAAIKEYNGQGGDTEGDVIRDLITDLCHHADKHGENTLDLLRAAISAWSAERRDPDDPQHGEVRIEIEDHE